ncbi:hypothetical protein K458DRAFT_11696 [Lentithecium fluviatile CBS 122367]|uniref:Uncharacterized protein n=1 Tax=Lentithecium fluviatile CBS 122367 TaxID=1168545 RepID=A0A6G1JPZ9_9PLEO|nr:hypothetical protein K458DRAFT_11696 [Lentithecium fluviatile CBS 122367]
MDYNDAAPPAIRRASRSSSGKTLTLDLYEPLEDLHIENSGSDEAAPPPIRLKKPASPKPQPSRILSLKPAPPPLPRKNPLRSRPDLLKSPPRSRNFSHPIREQFQPQLHTVQPISNRKPSSTVSYRSNPRCLPSLRRWSSLETIDSVTTTASVEDASSGDEPESPVAQESPLPSPLFFEDIDSAFATSTSLADPLTKLSPLFSHNRIDSTTTVPTTRHDIPRDEPDYVPSQDLRSTSHIPTIVNEDEDDGDSARLSAPSEQSSHASSGSSSLPSSSTPARPGRSARPSTATMLRRIKPKPREPLLTLQHLEIEKTVEFDQHSQRTNSSSSIPTISSGRPSELDYKGPSSSTSQQSLSSRGWKSSNFDTTTLSKAELKKCRKKSINPALYAEMKAARKGKLVSPIGGNTFL